MPHPSVTTNSQAPALKRQGSWARALAGAPGVILTLVWGFAEGTFFFVVPDVAISLVAMVETRRAWRHILAAVTGAVIAGMLFFDWSSRDPQAAGHAVRRVPFVTARMFRQADEGYRAHGVGAVFLGPLSGIPYKIYAVEAPRFLRRAVFLACTIPARAERFLIVWAGFGFAGSLLRTSWRWSASQVAALHGSFWFLFYAFYWGVIAFR